MPSGRGRGLGEWLWGLACGGALLGLLVASGRGGAGATGVWGPAAAGAQAGQEQTKGPPPIPGWYAVATAQGLNEAQTVKLHPGFAALAVGQGHTVHPAIPAGRMAVNFFGQAAVEEAGSYRFGVEAQGGTATLTVADGAGKKLAEVAAGGGADGRPGLSGWLDLPRGPVVLTVRFSRAEDKAARVRTLWEKQGVGDKGFRLEPIPPSAVTVPGYLRGPVQSAETELRGRVLLAELNCIACHFAGEKAESGLTRRRAPLLGEIGRRASPAWLARWIGDPQGLKPGCGMPGVLRDSTGDKEDAEAILHLLVSYGGPVPFEGILGAASAVEEGRTLYHTTGCIACHGALESATAALPEFNGAALPAEMPRSVPAHPLGDLKGKWRRVALAEFLRDPLRTHPGGRMPSMSLSTEEAEQIAMYLVRKLGPAKAGEGGDFVVDAAKVERGRAAFSARGCATCHEIGHNQREVRVGLTGKPLAQVRTGRGCLDPKDAKTPRYTLSDEDRTALAAGIEAIKRLNGAGTPAHAPIDQANRTIAALNCRACHSRNEEGGLADDLKPYFITLVETDLGDEGRLPPHLTGVGQKLHASWMRTVLTDGGKARPYMSIRMPQFGETHVGTLGAALAQMDGVAPGSDMVEPAAVATATDEMVMAGRRLAGEHGLSCYTCHSWAGKAGPNGPGPDMADFAERIRYDWYRTYLMAPGRFKPETKMTAFYRDGKGTVTEVFGGDPDRQADALWAYFATGRMGPAPEGLPTGAGLPVRVTDRPVVFRSFLKDAGSRGIAVGFPQGTHFAFDAGEARLVEAWRGEFLDATGSWKNRGGTVLGGQGAVVWKAPKGPPLVIGAKAPEAWPQAGGAEGECHFRGYRIEKDGVPVFMYRVGSAGVEERVEPADGSIRRAFTVSGVPAGARVFVNAGAGECRAGAGGAGANCGEIVDRGEGGGHVFEVPAAEAGKPVSFVVTITPSKAGG